MKTEIDPRKVNLAEKDIEDWLWENPESIGVEYWVGRQVAVPSGVIDLLGRSKHHEPVVVEVKNVEVSSDALAQVCRYASDIEEAVDILRISNDQTECYVTRKVIGRGDITDKIQYEADAMDVELYTFSTQLSLKISGKWGWKQETKRNHWAELGNLSIQEGFQSFLLPKVESSNNGTEEITIDEQVGNEG